MQGIVIGIPDIPRIYTAFAEWLFCMLLMYSTETRRKGVRLWAPCLAFLVFQSFFFVLTDHQEGVFWVFCMILAVCFMYVFIYFTYALTRYRAFFHLIEAFVLAEFTASFQWMMNYFYIKQGVDEKAVNVLSFLLVYGGVGILVLLFQRWRYTDKNNLEISLKEAVQAFVIGVTIFIASNISFLFANTPLSGSEFAIFQLRTLVDAIGLVMLYAYHVQIQNLQIRMDMVKMETILKNQYQQYEHSKEVSDNINFKYHDLKQYITILRKDMPEGTKKHLLDKIESEIHDFEVQNKTGNDILDTLLSAKSVTCRNQDITLTSVVNGRLLEFMDVIDICTIFGNILDNAIEYEKTIEDTEKRMINLTVVDRNKIFLVILCENYMGEGQIRLKNGLPETSKEDSPLHGYGLRSVQHAARKYEGEMSIDVSEGWFRMRILIPLP